MTLTIFSLGPEHSKALSTLMVSEEPSYSQYFTPFSFDTKSLESRLSAAKRDRYWGIRWREDLAGFFMLRGFDEGYERPSFGVYIAEAFSRYGLGKLALYYALSWCRLNKIRAVMLKVHPDNVYARRIYEDAGFQLLEICKRTGHRTYEIRWERNE
ncbi:MAG: GNAT family N-acetyltransferase [Candidatus Promineifilaceae bacterium]